MPTVTANGKPITTHAVPCTLDQLLEEQGFLPKSVVVELNGEAISPSEFAQHQVQEGDRLEIVRIVAGG